MEKITSKAVLGEFKRGLEIIKPPSWVGRVANTFMSDEASEEYAWLDATPGMREWVGGRNAKGFKENSITIKNLHFEDTIEILKRDMRRDKFGMIQARVKDLVTRAQSHPAELLSTLMINGESTTCYDGQYFFDTDHSEGDSGTLSNDISVDISALPTTVHGSTTAPSVEEFQLAVTKGISQLFSFKDSAGKPVNQGAKSFVVMVPHPFYMTALQALGTPSQVAASQTALQEMKSKFNIELEVNPYLTWTTKFAVYRADGYIKPFIFQRETAINVSAKAEGSEFEFDNDAHQYGVDYWGNVAYGLWQHACLVTLA